MANIWHVFKIWILCTQMLRKTVIKMYIFVKHNFLKNYISINFFFSGKSVVLFTCVPPMDSLVTINVGKILQFIFHIPGGGGGKLLLIHSLQWNPNNVLTTCKEISKGSCQQICVLITHIKSKTIDQRSWEETKTWWSKAGLFFTIIYFGNWQIYWLFVALQTWCGFLFLLNNFPLQSLEYATHSSI